MDNRVEFRKLVKEHGFKSVLAFCEESGIDRANLDKNLTGVYRISLDRTFIIAKTLGVSLEEVLWLFREDEMKEYTACCKQS